MCFSWGSCILGSYARASFNTPLHQTIIPPSIAQSPLNHRPSLNHGSPLNQPSLHHRISTPSFSTNPRVTRACSSFAASLVSVSVRLR